MLLAAEGIQLGPGALMATARTVNSGDDTATRLSREGNIGIQDEGSQLVAALVGQGRRILDCCAGPGGKTAAMAARMPGAEIVATELHPHRATVLRRLAPQQNVEVVTADALALPYGADFDRVLPMSPVPAPVRWRNPELNGSSSPKTFTICNRARWQSCALPCATSRQERLVIHLLARAEENSR